MISRFILINFQTNPMIIVNFFTFVHELLDSPSYVLFVACLFVVLVISHFGFEDRILVLVVPVPGH